MRVGDAPWATTAHEEEDGSEADDGGHKKCDGAPTEANGYR
jgi:hypothetical protein